MGNLVPGILVQTNERFRLSKKKKKFVREDKGSRTQVVPSDNWGGLVRRDESVSGFVSQFNLKSPVMHRSLQLLYRQYLKMILNQRDSLLTTFPGNAFSKGRVISQLTSDL